MVYKTVDTTKLSVLLKEAGKLLFDRTLSGDITTKGRADFVTKVDTSVQAFLGRELTSRWPDIQFMSEEQDNSGLDKKKALWILDPVDGTTNLIYDLRFSAISLALVEEGKVQLGLIYQPYSDELFFAKRGEGAFLNGQPISVSQQDDIKRSLIAIGTSPYEKNLAAENFARFQRVFEACADLRRMGTASLDLAYVACGRFDAFFERGLKPWDYAAGYLIIEEAGGVVTDFTGGTPDPTVNADLLAHNGKIGSSIPL